MPDDFRPPLHDDDPTTPEPSGHAPRSRRIMLTGLAACVAAGTTVAVLTPGAHAHPSHLGHGSHALALDRVLLQTPDPSGGPRWGLELVRGSGPNRGRVCPEVGRVRDGRLGTVGPAGAGFRPLTPADRATAACTDGADGAIVFTVLTPSAAASGDPRLSAASAAGARTLEYGFYGPQAASVSYLDGRRSVTRATGPGGSFLVVLPRTSRICRPGSRVCSTLRPVESAGPGTVTGALTRITYRVGSPCVLGTSGASSSCSAPRR